MVRARVPCREERRNSSLGYELPRVLTCTTQSIRWPTAETRISCREWQSERVARWACAAVAMMHCDDVFAVSREWWERHWLWQSRRWERPHCRWNRTMLDWENRSSSTESSIRPGRKRFAFALLREFKSEEKLYRFIVPSVLARIQDHDGEIEEARIETDKNHRANMKDNALLSCICHGVIENEQVTFNGAPGHRPSQDTIRGIFCPVPPRAKRARCRNDLSSMIVGHDRGHVGDYLKKTGDDQNNDDMVMRWDVVSSLKEIDENQDRADSRWNRQDDQDPEFHLGKPLHGVVRHSLVSKDRCARKQNWRCSGCDWCILRFFSWIIQTYVSWRVAASTCCKFLFSPAITLRSINGSVNCSSHLSLLTNSSTCHSFSTHQSTRAVFVITVSCFSAFEHKLEIWQGRRDVDDSDADLNRFSCEWFNHLCRAETEFSECPLAWIRNTWLFMGVLADGYVIRCFTGEIRQGLFMCWQLGVYCHWYERLRTSSRSTKLADEVHEQHLWPCCCSRHRFFIASYRSQTPSWDGVWSFNQCILYARKTLEEIDTST